MVCKIQGYYGLSDYLIDKDGMCAESECKKLLGGHFESFLCCEVQKERMFAVGGFL